MEDKNITAIPLKPIKRRLTLKQRRFIKEYTKTGNGTQSALIAYDTNSDNIAHAIASENLQKPAVKESIQEILNKSGLDDTTISQELASIALKEGERPISYGEKIKALELALKLSGKLDKTSTKVSVSLSQRLEGKSFSELKKDMEDKSNRASRLLGDLD